jgi:hypothetical protein
MLRPERYSPALMRRELVADERWDTFEPLIPPEPPKPTGGRPHITRARFRTPIPITMSINTSESTTAGVSRSKPNQR